MATHPSGVLLPTVTPVGAAPRAWTEAQLVEAVADVSRGAAVPRSWGELDLGCQRLYAIRVSTSPPMTVAEAARALGIPRVAAEERWLRVRMTTGCESLEPTTGTQLVPLDPEGDRPPLPIPAPEFVSDSDLKTLMRRRAFEGAVMADPRDPRTYRDLATACRTWLGAVNDVADNPLEVRKAEDREALRELAMGLAAEMKRRGFGVTAPTVIDVTPTVSHEDV